MKKKIFSYGELILKHELINNSLFIFIGSNISNVLAFVFNLFLVRRFTPEDYGQYTSLVSLIALVGIPVQTITTVIIQFATDYFAKNEIGQASRLYYKMFRFILILSTILLIGFVLLSPFIKSFLHLDNVWYGIMVGLIVFISYLNVINGSFLQSLLKFSFMSSLSILSGFVKLLLGILFISLGFRIFGALGAIFLTIFFSFIIGFVPLRFLIKRSEGKNVIIQTKKILSYALPTSLAVLSLSSFTSTDIILVKHFFNANEAGFYAGLSTVAKVIFYFTGPIPMVMFPLIIKRSTNGKNYKNLFYLSLVLVSIPSLLITAFYFIAPELSINFFLGGGRYLDVASYLGLFGLYISIFSVLNVCVTYFLSLKKTNISFFIAFGAILQVILISLFHNSLLQVIELSILISFLLLILFIIYYRYYGQD